jgi:hypothetical protein
MNVSFWSDENRWFVPRRLGFGYSFNFKYMAKKLRWIKPTATDDASAEADATQNDLPETPEERLRRSIDDSRYEDR